MPQLHETVYPKLISRYSEKALAFNFTPTAADMAFVKSNAKKPTIQSILLVMLKVTQHLRYVPSPDAIPYSVIKFIVAFLGENVLQKKFFLDYQLSGTMKRHSRLLREYLSMENDDKKRQTFCLSKGAPLAEVKENLADIINALIELMIQHNFELPAFSSLEKMARLCRSQANERLYERLCSNLSKEQLQHIDALFEKVGNGENSCWQRLKQEPNKPTVTHIRAFIEHLQWLKSCAEPLPNLVELPMSKRDKFRDEAMALHNNEMRRLKKSKRLALAITLVQTQLTQALDDLTDMLIKVLSEIEQEGKRAYQTAIYETRDRADELIIRFRTVLNAYQSTADIQQPAERLEVIDAALAEHADDMVASCEAHLALNAHDERPYVLKAYRRKRTLLFQIIENLPLDASTESRRLLTLANLLKDLYHNDKSEIVSLELPSGALSHLSRGWLPLIEIDDHSMEYPLNRFALEAAWFLAIGAQLKTFNCFISGGVKYGDPNEQLISWEDYQELSQDFTELSGIPTDGKRLVEQLKAELTNLANDIDARFPDLEGVTLKDDELILRRAHTHYRSDTLEPLHSA